MKSAPQALTEILVAALIADGDFAGIDVLPATATDDRPKPCLILSALPQPAPHRRSTITEVTLEYLSNRNDTTSEAARSVQAKIDTLIERDAFILAQSLYAEGWQVRSFTKTAPFDEEGSDDDWRTGYEYRLVMFQI